jgi:FkbH-like protein
MSGPVSLADLPWLEPCPADFRARCKALDAAEGDKGEALRRLATHRLDISQLNRLARSLIAARTAGTDLAPLRPFRLGLLSNATTDLLAPALAASALRHGIALEVVTASFGQVVQEAVDPTSAINQARPDAVLLALDHRGLGLKASGAGDSAALVEAALGMVAAVREGLQTACGAPLIVQTVAPVPKPLFGSLDYRTDGGPARLIADFNQGLVDQIRGEPDLLFDVASLAATVGYESWHDPAQWHLAKLSFAQRLVPLYADHLARLLAAARGLSRKCLVLDLDNTVWGGVVGDDGLEGIEVGQGSPGGEAFLAIQQMALDLRARGVVLAVCSKNDDAVARRAFRDHPDMLLREEHIAVFQANWIDKPANLAAIARTLDIGIDSLVFVDDNPAERAIVRRELPQVAVPELPADPALYPRVVLGAGYFEAVAFSDDDRRRAEQYRANAERAQLQASATDLDGYLRSLDMTIRLAPFDGAGRSRIAQLINKSNQFNLTTRRYTEAEVAHLEADPGTYTLQVRLEDRFGDNGMISVVICRMRGEVWEIDTWLMSCRVLGRRVEQAVLNEIAAAAKKAGARYLEGRFIPSGRNEMVRDHYAKLGFAPMGCDGDISSWRLELAACQAADIPMNVITTRTP